MSFKFIQCIDGSDVERVVTKLGQVCFVSSDNRIHDAITIYDEHCVIDVDASTLYDLLQLNDQITMMDGTDLEKSFSDLKSQAEELENCFKKVRDNLIKKPIKNRNLKV